jgi:ABC-2 type transport system ATP-binding protein
MENVFVLSGLRKSYGARKAVDGVDLAVRRGEIFGLLGHNGAGKTTAIECSLGVKRADAGTASILGLDPVRDRKRLFARVGVQFQESRFQDKLKVSEACALASALYPAPMDWRPLAERLGLAGKAEAFVAKLSGGERQRLSILLALIPDPEILFLDELTTGLDPKARREIWACIEELKRSGVTIILTSHYMDEVERLCDRIAILREGGIVARGTPAELMQTHGMDRLEDVFLRYLDQDRLRPEEESR